MSRCLVRIRQFAAVALLTLPSGQALGQQGAVHPPDVIERKDAQYPEGVWNEMPVHVTLFVSLDAQGSVTQVDVIDADRPEFGNAAREAVLGWRFSPATRNGHAVAARIRVPFTFPARAQEGARTAERQVPPAKASVEPVTAALAPTAGSAPPVVEAQRAAPEASATTLQAAGQVPTAPNDRRAAPAGAATVAGPRGSAAVHREPPISSGSRAVPSNEAATAAGAPGDSGPTEVIVQGQYRPPTRGAGDFHIDVGQLSHVPRKNAAEVLQLAPGILLTNEGGEGHAHQVFLRGFDAREGQDIEFSVGGVPINEAGNLHGNGHADLHFIIPETVLSLRVLEGPFDPRQGNFAVAGSADYRLGLERRGLTLKSTVGSYGTRRLLGLWGPSELSRCTFGAAEVYQTDGFGKNRDAQRASAVAQYEGRFGATGSYRVTGQAYSATYHSAGVVRDDDYRAGRIGFYDTYDPRQGGDSSRYSIAADLEENIKGTLYREQLYVIRRDVRFRRNYTGYLLDVQEPTQSPHGQRGDGVDLNVDSWTVGSRGSSRVRETIGGLEQSLEVGYAARGDFGRGTQLRVRSSNAIPYQRDIDVEYTLGDIGVYTDVNLRFLSWLTLRGGVRANYFSYNVLDNCAQKEVRQPSRSNPPGDESCLAQSDFGAYRDRTQRVTTATTSALPRASLLLAPAPGLLLSMSYGRGVRSVDPIYVSQDLKTPFAGVDALEAGIMYARTLSRLSFVARTAAFRTHVGQDLIFSETAGRNTLTTGTTRNGMLAALRLTGTFFDENVSVTLVQSKFDDTGYAVPYIPNWVVRSDSALHHELPVRIDATNLTGALGAGVTYIGRRPLPYNEMGDPIFTVDASATVGWRRFELSLEATNLLDRRYRLGEYNYASNFQGPDHLPTLVPVRHFTAGAPRMVFLSLAITFGGQS